LWHAVTTYIPRTFRWRLRYLPGTIDGPARARSRRNDAELFAGLVQACRYCDELDASIAAHLRGRHLDPHLMTSAAHTYFLLGDYANTLDCYSKKGGYYLDCAALVATGEHQAALSKLREREQSGVTTGAVQGIMRSLRAYLEGSWEECLNAILGSGTAIRKDPEVLFYSARHLARINETDRAISALSTAIDRGFLCASVISRDPWFAPLRSLPRYIELMKEAERRRSETHACILGSGGRAGNQCRITLESYAPSRQRQTRPDSSPNDYRCATTRHRRPCVE